jgi:hypothetical protein
VSRTRCSVLRAAQRPGNSFWTPLPVCSVRLHSTALRRQADHLHGRRQAIYRFAGGGPLVEELIALSL